MASDPKSNDSVSAYLKSDDVLTNGLKSSDDPSSDLKSSDVLANGLKSSDDPSSDLKPNDAVPTGVEQTTEDSTISESAYVFVKLKSSSADPSETQSTDDKPAEIVDSFSFTSSNVVPTGVTAECFVNHSEASVSAGQLPSSSPVESRAASPDA
eukprot:608942_1